MKWIDYQRAAMTFAVHDRPWQEQLENAAYGLIGETGEIVDLLKKQRWHGHHLNKVKIIEEVGDCFWYCALALHQVHRGYPIHFNGNYAYTPRTIYRLVERIHLFCVSFPPTLIQHRVKLRQIENIVHTLCCILTYVESTPEEAMQRNIDKLSTRYPQGFTSSASIARVDVEVA